MTPPTPGPQSKTAYARQQQKNTAEARRRLWTILKYKVINNGPFRKNEPLVSIIADFYCPAAKLVILLDDGLPDGGAFDNAVKRLAAAGCTAVRLNTEDVRRNTMTVFNQLRRRFSIREMPKPAPDGYSGPSNLS